MMAPRGLIGAALLLWGASVGFLPVAVILALAYEGARFVPPSPAAARRITLVGRIVLFAVIAKLTAPPIFIEPTLTSTSSNCGAQGNA